MKTVVSLVLFLATAFTCRADFEEGLKAYDRGDFAAALRQWVPIAEHGDAHAQYNLGLLYATGGHGVARNYTEAARWYREAAAQGVLAAEYNLGILYSNGQGVARDYAQAAKWFTHAADMGIGIAQQNLGDMYYEKGAFNNYQEALRWYRKAAGQGLAEAQYDVGVIYDLGQGVPSNYQEALKWYQLAADQGHAGAYTNIGILYYNGQGVKRNLLQAYAWLRRAALAGEPRSLDLLQVVSDKITRKQMEEGNVLAASWKPPKTAAAEAADKAALEAALFKRPETQSSGEAAREEPGAEKTAQRSTPAAEWTGVERVVAVGDIHGDFEQFVSVLESASLIDGNGNWTGGKTHLVQIGDVLDRGPDSRKVMDLLMKLQRQAAASGGHVHVLIGNHEAMNVYGDLRYVSPGEFEAFRDPNSAPASDFSYDEGAAPQMAAKPDLNRLDWAPSKPTGFSAYRAALSPEGKYGKWIAGHNTVIKIDDTLFVHAGISPKYAGWSMERINDEVRAELADPVKLRGGIVVDADGPLWYRGLGQGGGTAMEPPVENILRNYGVKRIVIGHIYANGAITPRFDGKVILIDVGLSRIYDGVGKLGCLVIEGDKPYALHRGQKLELPAGSGDLVRYLKQVAVLEKSASAAQ